MSAEVYGGSMAIVLMSQPSPPMRTSTRLFGGCANGGISHFGREKLLERWIYGMHNSSGVAALAVTSLEEALRG